MHLLWPGLPEPTTESKKLECCPEYAHASHVKPYLHFMGYNTKAEDIYNHPYYLF